METIYDELKKQRRWVPVDGSKRPTCPWTDESHWRTRDQIKGRAGYVIPDNHYITIIDFDKCLEGDEIVDNPDGRYTAEEVEAWLGMFSDCPAFRSISGRGLHVIVSGSVPDDVKVPLEVYNGHAARQIVLTGEQINDVTDLPTKQVELNTLYQMVTQKGENGTKSEPSSPTLKIPTGERHHWRIKQLGTLINQGIRDKDALLKMLEAAQSGFDPPIMRLFGSNG